MWGIVFVGADIGGLVTLRSPQIAGPGGVALEAPLARVPEHADHRRNGRAGERSLRLDDERVLALADPCGRAAHETVRGLDILAVDLVKPIPWSAARAWSGAGSCVSPGANSVW
jgi:hypothetical protein